MIFVFFFFQAEDGIRDHCVTGVQTCALPISNLKLAQVTFERVKKLSDRGVLSPQDKDDKEAALAVRNAEVTQSQARISTARSEERRVGKECRCRLWTYHKKKKKAGATVTREE